MGYFYERAKARQEPIDRLRKAAKKRDLPKGVASTASMTTLKTFLEKPTLWEYLLFEGFLSDQLESLKAKRLDLVYGKPNLDKRVLQGEESFDAISSYSGSLMRIVATLEKLINEGIVDAWGEPGVPADVGKLYDLSKRFGELYTSAIECSVEMRAVNAEPETERVLLELSSVAVHVLDKIDEVRNRLFYELAVLEGLSSDELEGREIDIMIDVGFDFTPVEDSLRDLKMSLAVGI